MAWQMELIKMHQYMKFRGYMNNSVTVTLIFDPEMAWQVELIKTHQYMKFYGYM